VDALGNGDASFLDATHLVVRAPGGRSVLLDTTSGKTAALSARETLWCSSTGLFKVDEEKDLNSAELRTEGTRFSPCTTAGKFTSTLPATTPSTVGVTVDGVFLWPSPHGLSRHVVGAAQGIA
jgi:hypothetical protein